MKSEYALKVFEEQLRSKGYSAATMRKYRAWVESFLVYVRESGNVRDVREIVSEDLRRFFETLRKKKAARGKALSEWTLYSYHSTLKCFFAFLLRQEYLLSSPFDAAGYVAVKRHLLPRSVSEERMKDFLDEIEEDTAMGLRDRAIFELLYGTGVRLSELVKLDLSDVDFVSGKILVREGKGGKDRIVPVGRNALKVLTLYLSQARGLFLKRKENKGEENALFLSARGKRVGGQNVYLRCREYFRKAGVEKGSPHMLRHSFATHILERGARILQVKEILGHASMDTTTIYTQFSISGLKRIMKKYHPRENELYVEMTAEERAAYETILTRADPRY
jgi:site-specific recombinase XerD